MITRFEQAIEMAESEPGASLVEIHGARVAGAILRTARIEYLATPRLSIRLRAKQQRVEVRNGREGSHADEREQPADFALHDAFAPQAQG